MYIVVKHYGCSHHNTLSFYLYFSLSFEEVGDPILQV